MKVTSHTLCDAHGIRHLQLQLCDSHQQKLLLQALPGPCNIPDRAQKCAQGTTKGYKAAGWPVTRAAARACQSSPGSYILCIRAGCDAVPQHELRRRGTQKVGQPDHRGTTCPYCVPCFAQMSWCMAILACRAGCMFAFLIFFHISDTCMACCNIGYYWCMLNAPIRWVCCLPRLLFMSCSTLDPVLRMERQGVTPQGLALILAITAYLFAKPGVLAISFNAELQLFSHCLHA